MLCAYCSRSEEDLLALGYKYKFSKEHILPRSLVGSLENNIFTLPNVCGVCNNLAGSFIDAPAVRSWLMHMNKALYDRDHAIITPEAILPLVYIGESTVNKFKDKVCDMWIGPTGDSIYHFHSPYPEKPGYPSVVGIPPYANKKDVDKGFAFLFVVSNNPEWHHTIFWSFIKKFQGGTLYLGNGNRPPGNVFSEIPKELEELQKTLSANEVQNVSNFITPNSENRFLAKVAIGIGTKFLGETFVKSESAANLRKYMWAKSDEERDGVKLHGTNFYNPGKKLETEMVEYFGWEVGHLIAIVNMYEYVSITITLFNKISASVRIEKSDVSDYDDVLGRGICIAVAPAVKKVVGPFNYFSFVKHKMFHTPIMELHDIERELKGRREKRPPVHI